MTIFNKQNFLSTVSADIGLVYHQFTCDQMMKGVNGDENMNIQQEASLRKQEIESRVNTIRAQLQDMKLSSSPLTADEKGLILDEKDDIFARMSSVSRIKILHIKNINIDDQQALDNDIVVPEEIFHEIIKYSNESTVHSLRMVSSRFNQLVFTVIKNNIPLSITSYINSLASNLDINYQCERSTLMEMALNLQKQDSDTSLVSKSLSDYPLLARRITRIRNDVISALSYVSLDKLAQAIQSQTNLILFKNVFILLFDNKIENSYRRIQAGEDTDPSHYEVHLFMLDLIRKDELEAVFVFFKFALRFYTAGGGLSDLMLKEVLTGLINKKEHKVAFNVVQLVANAVGKDKAAEFEQFITHITPLTISF